MLCSEISSLSLILFVMSQEGKSAFFENDKDTIQRQIEIEHAQIDNITVEDYFEIENTAKLIQQRNFKNVQILCCCLSTDCTTIS